MKTGQIAFFVMALLMASLAAVAAEPWYEGGTLQKATVAEWLGATPEDQLATSGDFIASLSAVTDISKVTPGEQADIKKRAEDLRTCINETITESGAAPDKAVAQLVVVCTILKKKK